MTTVIWRRALAAGLRVALIDARCLRQNRASLAALEVGKGKPRGRDQSGSVGQCRRSNRRSEQASRAKRQPVNRRAVIGERRTAGRAPVVASLAGKSPARARIGRSNGFIS